MYVEIKFKTYNSTLDAILVLFYHRRMLDCQKDAFFYMIFSIRILTYLQKCHVLQGTAKKSATMLGF